MSEPPRLRRGNGALPAPLADSFTPILNLTLPEVGASASTWGGKLNQNFTVLDNSVQSSGGTIYGALNVDGLVSLFGGMNVTGQLNAYNGLDVGGGDFGVSGNAWISGTCTAGTITGGAFVCNQNANIGGTLTAQYLASSIDTDVGGNVNVTGSVNVNGNGYFNGGCTANTLASNGNADITGDVFGANIVTGGGVFGANLEASVQGYKPGGGMWADSSDRRLKRDVRNYDVGLSAVCGLRPVAFQFNGLGGTVDDGRTYVGLIAQEAQQLMPELVGSRRRPLRQGDRQDTEILTLDATALVFALVNCIRELTERVNDLEARR